jgi:hypothetical protein
MNFLTLLALLISNSQTASALDTDLPIIEPRLVQLGGTAGSCLQDLLVPHLREGQHGLALTGPNPDIQRRSRLVMKLMANPPIESYQIEFETGNGRPWEFYNFKEGQRTYYGFKAAELKRMARVTRSIAGFPASQPLGIVDLSPCEALLTEKRE